MTTTVLVIYRWEGFELFKKAMLWYQSMRKRMRSASEYSLWWSFVWDWKKNLFIWLKDFKLGCYQFSPLKQYEFSKVREIRINFNVGAIH